ncbi:class I SAM-dependent methyltransferase [Lapillicoccus jejuensis]|uniref:Methyltransferase family protein n=1 Tax=Lapillicoccus jejuensis TaxID=402171 RepID=A0A542E3Z7_9MICO|nr:class I SAM-dependent methyltransferase [Lapillicoccus jejuensis]TQJ10019.1 methyltransferase family protein [Lapillicoccus jejuensis]
MSFEVAAEAYDRFMGRFSAPLSPRLCDLAGLGAGSGRRALDVGCGPGQLTVELVRRLGADHVVAVDPSAPFVAAARDRLPGVDVRQAPGEALPFDDGTVDAALAQLVVSFFRDPVGGLREMARVTRPGGVVAVSTWDLAGDRAPHSSFWRVLRRLHPDVDDESGMPGAGDGRLPALLDEAGLGEVAQHELHVTRDFDGFDDWWGTYQLGVGPPGDAVRRLDDAARTQLREACRAELGDGPLTIAAVAWAATGTVAG